jgi:hypothetical protein
MASGQTTNDHGKIRKWVEERGGKPAAVKASHKGDDGGILRIDFPADGKDEGLEEISWEEFFRTFEDRKLSFLYQDKTENGKTSRFFKFVNRQ